MENCRDSILVDIRRVPEIYRSIFAAYPSFNKVQSTVFLDVFNSDHSVVLSAPTGSGKTVIFELAIVRQLMAAEQSKYSNIFQIVYISPMKALCEERLIDWHKKFSPFGINPISVTGDSDYMDYNSLSNHKLIITTPEKWDSISRRWKENKRLIQVINLFMIDEVHLLNEENRGASLEAMVCRMKTIQSSLYDDTEQNTLCSKQNIRFLAVSATFPNIEDVGNWLGAKYFSFESSMRPVKLNTIVLGFNYNRTCSQFKFDISLNYRLPSLILKYSNGKPTLIFCSTRKSVEMAAKHLVQNLTIPLSDNQKEILNRAVSSISDSKLRSDVVHGIGYHHGGLLPETRSIIEQLFRSGGLPVLVTTSTLATGVNLPAHLVIIKSTKFYDKGGFQDYAPSALLQMLGRAGRPQFDTEATALILTSTADVAKFEKMVDGKENIESNLHRHLTEHLNAEIVLRTITDLDVAMRWLSSTFLYIRARKNPRHYGIPLGLTEEKIDKKLLEICQIDLNKLVKNGMASMDEDVNISPTFLGTLMAKYYISFESVKLFKTMNGKEILQQVLSLISKSKEFSDMRLRVDEKKCLNLLNRTKNENSIRFPFNGKIKTLDMKINCIIQAVFGCLEIEDHSILSEAFRIMRLGERVCRCLIEYLETKENCYSALLNTIVLWKCFRAQLWENTKHLTKQFPGIGLVTSKQLCNAGITSFEKLIKSNPRDIEMITKKKPPFGNKIVDLAKSMPRYDMKVEKIFCESNFKLKIRLTLLNPEAFDVSTFVNASSVMCLLIGDNLNQILLHERYMHSYMVENIEVVRFVQLNTDMHDLTEILCNFVSEDLVGIDICENFIMKQRTPCEKTQSQNSKSRKNKTSNKTPKRSNDGGSSNLVQTQIDKYMKCKKNIDSPQIQPLISKPEESIKGLKYKEECVDLGEKNSIVKETEKLNENLYTKYSLTQFEESIIEINSNDENSKHSMQDQKKAFKSFTDEEILESVEFLLDHNQNRAENNMQKTNNQQESVNIGTSVTTDFLRSDLDGEFSKLYDKYGSTKQSTANIDKRSDMEDRDLGKNNTRIMKIDLNGEFLKLQDKYGTKQSMANIDKREEIKDKVPEMQNARPTQIDSDEGYSKLHDKYGATNHLADIDKIKEKENEVPEMKNARIVNIDLYGEFSNLHAKYRNTNDSTAHIDNRKEMEDKIIEKKNVRLTKIDSHIRKTSRDILRNGKLHSVGSFENALFNPQKDSLSLFRYQPTKRFAHAPRDNDPPSAPESKRKKLDTSNEKVSEDMMENLEKFIEPHEKESSQYSKSIKWRSPLIYSPPVKFSPKIPSSFSFSVPMPRNNDSENSHDWSLNTVETNNSSKTVRSLSGATPVAYKNQSQKRTQNPGTKFLLSDRENTIEQKPLNNRNNMPMMPTPQKSQQIQDFFSSSFLEDMGYSEKQNITSNFKCFSQKAQDLNTSVQSAGSYYHDMVAKNPQSEQNSEVLRPIPQKSFFLNQNHLSLPENRTANNANHSVTQNSNQLFGPKYNQRDFFSQNTPVIPNRNIPTQAMAMIGSHNLDNRLLTDDPVSYQNILTRDTVRPELHFNAGNINSTVTGNTWPHNTISNQNNRTVSSLQMVEYPPEGQERHHGIHYDSEFNNTQSSFTHANPLNNTSLGRSSKLGMNRPKELSQPDQIMPNIMTTHHNPTNFEGTRLHPFSKPYPPDLDNSYYFDRGNPNYQMNILGNNAYARSLNLPQLEPTQGFFLNQVAHPGFDQGPSTIPMWNTVCVVHKILNCRFCLSRNYPMQLNINKVDGFTRKRSLNEMSSGPSALPHASEAANEYWNNSVLAAPFSQQYVDGVNQNNSYMERGGASKKYGMQNYDQQVNRALRCDTDMFNKYGVQSSNVPREMAYHDFPMSNDGNDITGRDQNSSKSFMISKFLNSFDDSSKNQK